MKWVKGFLSNRKQRVAIGDNSSEWVEVTNSVSQDSFLGPLLLTVFKMNRQIELRINTSCMLMIVNLLGYLNDMIMIQTDIESCRIVQGLCK